MPLCHVSILIVELHNASEADMAPLGARAKRESPCPALLLARGLSACCTALLPASCRVGAHVGVIRTCDARFPWV